MKTNPQTLSHSRTARLLMKGLLLLASCMLFLPALENDAEAASCQDNAKAVPLLGVHAVPDPVFSDTDPDWLSLLEERAKRAVTSAEWAERFKEHRAFIQKWADTPQYSRTLPPATATVLLDRPTGFGADTLAHSPFPPETFRQFSRHWLFIDATRPAEVAFAEKLMTSLSDTVSLRVILTGGSVGETASRLRTRIFADQGANLIRRLGLLTSPSLVTLTPERIRIWSPALNSEGDPDEAVPAEALGLKLTVSNPKGTQS